MAGPGDEDAAAPPPRRSGNALLSGAFQITRLVTVAAAILVFEVLLAFALYTYLALNHTDLFGAMVRVSSGALRFVAETVEARTPEFADLAYATLLGELGPKSALLLFLGLFASGALRLTVWLTRAFLRWVGGMVTPRR